MTTASNHRDTARHAADFPSPVPANNINDTLTTLETLRNQKTPSAIPSLLLDPSAPFTEWYFCIRSCLYEDLGIIPTDVHRTVYIDKETGSLASTPRLKPAPRGSSASEKAAWLKEQEAIKDKELAKLHVFHFTNTIMLQHPTIGFAPGTLIYNRKEASTSSWGSYHSDGPVEHLEIISAGSANSTAQAVHFKHTHNGTTTTAMADKFSFVHFLITGER